jgi:hypothetical protein
VGDRHGETDRHGYDGSASAQRAIGVAAHAVHAGRRGRSPIKSVLLGSVSDAAVQGGRRRVLIVPGDEG